MRSLLGLAILLSAGTAHADEPALWEAELRLGYGLAVGGGGGMTSTKSTPLSVTAIGAMAIQDEPRMAAYGGLTVETLDRNAVGAVAGVRLAPFDGKVRLSGGGTWIFAPYTLWGATASGGVCRRSRGLGLCGDLQLTAYFAGTDLAEGHTVTQIQAVVGVVFDAF
ncbi:MAG: hypothetical protein ABI867_00110 [Kofleriaceae bacterium]